MNKKILFVLVTTLLVVSACSPAAPAQEAMTEKPTEAMMDKTSDEMMAMPTEEMTAEPSDSMHEMPAKTATDAMMSEDSMMAPAWFDVSFTNVNSGEEFKVSDFAGKVVLVENLAMWCPTCKKQQGEIKSLHEALGMNSDLVTIGFDVDPNEVASDLKKYTESNGFDWYYAVAPMDVTQNFEKLYGAQYLNPPSAPMLIIDRKGEVHTLPFGLKSADDLKTALDPYLAEGM